MVHLTHCVSLLAAASVGVLQITAQIACSGIRLPKLKVKEHLPWDGLGNVFSYLRFTTLTCSLQRRKHSGAPPKGISPNSGDE
jgi:hypothetical protein